MKKLKFLILFGLLVHTAVSLAVPPELLQKMSNQEKTVLNTTYTFLKKKSDGTLIFNEKSYYDDESTTKRKIRHYNLPDDMMPLKVGIYGRFKNLLPSKSAELCQFSFEAANFVCASLMLYGFIMLQSQKESGDIFQEDFDEQSSLVTKNPLAWLSALGALGSTAKLFLNGHYILMGEDYSVVQKPAKQEDSLIKNGVIQFLKTMLIRK